LRFRFRHAGRDQAGCRSHLENQAEPAVVDTGDLRQPFDIAHPQPTAAQLGNGCGAEGFEYHLDFAQQVDRRACGHRIDISGAGRRHHRVGCGQPDGSGKFTAQCLADQPGQDHRFVVHLTQQPVCEQTLHRAVRRRAGRGVAGAADRRAFQQPLQQFGLRLVESGDAVREIGGDGVFDRGLTGGPGQAGRGLGGHPHRIVAPHQRALTQVVDGRGDRRLAARAADQLQQLGQRYRGRIGMQDQQPVDHREVKKVQVIGGRLDRLPCLSPRRQRRDGPRRGLCQVGPQLEQPNQLLIAEFGQPGAERHARCVFGHC
jgi:hypothetical protein